MYRLLCLLGLFSTLAAVEAKDARTCRVVFLSAPPDAPETLHLFDGKTSREVTLPGMNFSPVYPLPSGELLLRMLPAEVTDPEKTPPDAPSVAVPEAVTDFYLLVSSDPANSVAPVKLEIIDATKLLKGHMLWVNLTPNTLDGLLGTVKLELEPNSKKLLSPPTSKNEDYAANLSYRKPDSDVLRPLSENKWSHDHDVRTVFFVVQTEANPAPRILGLSDHREPVAKEGKKKKAAKR
ncbi:MAG: hypothetical protein V4689_09080 [Verrucomicrobiota bacterium]